MNNWFRLALFLRNSLNFLKIWVDYFGNQCFICIICKKEYATFQEWFDHLCSNDLKGGKT